MTFILGRKLNMDRAFTDEGEAIPITIIQAGPCAVTQIKDAKKDGYQAIQLGFDPKKKLNKPQKGHLKDLDNYRVLREFRVDKVEDYQKGQALSVEQFQIGDLVKITGLTKGKGFQGVVKRYGFKGSPATHGHKDQLRMPGSIGATGPQKVFKGTRLPGRMGGGQSTSKNLEVVELDKEKNVLIVKGSVPGARNNLLIITKCGHQERIKKETPSESKKVKPAEKKKPEEKKEDKPAKEAAKKEVK